MPTPTSPTPALLRLAFAALVAQGAACTMPAPGTPAPPSPSPATSAPAAPAPPGRAAAPWSNARLGRSEVPATYVTQWTAAENRASCALVAPRALATDQAATPRAATFAGGWAVAYDIPGTRSAFGVAGTGISASGPLSYRWPYAREWADGSRTEYGPEGGSGPNELAYLRIAGQGCLYNVWSRLGRPHLEALLEQLRFVAP